MILAAAQTKPIQADIDFNLDEHYKFVKLAVKHKAELITFPELSITSYVRENAEKLAFTENDPRLFYLKKLAAEHNIIIIAGAPIKVDGDLYIGSFVIKPNNQTEIYTKQFLHSGEELFFQSSFDYNPQIKIGKEKLLLAICADIDHPEHAENACALGTTVYLPSIFFSKKGIPEAYKNLSSYAKRHSMNILMSNFGGTVWGNQAAGKSAFWNNTGELVASINHNESGLLLVKKVYNEWIGDVVEC